MAYVFNDIQNILDKNDPDKQNIFDNGGTRNLGSQGGAQDQTKTSTEGDLGAGGSSGSTNANKANSFAAGSSSDSSRAAYAANVGKADTPYAATYAQNQLGKKQQSLQDQSDAYLKTGMANQNYSFSNDEIGNAVKQGDLPGDTDSFSKIVNTLGMQNARQADAFAPTSTSVKEIGLLSTPAGQRELVKAGQRPDYTPGMASFDVAALQGNKNFTDLRNDLMRKQTDLNAQADKLRTDLPQQVQTAGQQNLQTAQQGIKDYLGTLKTGITDAEAAEAQRRAAQDAADFNNAFSSGLGTAVNQARQTLNAQNPNIANYLSSEGFDPSKYGATRGSYSLNEVATPEQIAQFNNIASLLGSEEAQNPAIQGQPGYTFNQDALTADMIRNAQNIWNPIAEGYQNEILSTQNSLAAQAAAENARRAGLDPRAIGAQELQKLMPQIDASGLGGRYKALQSSLGGMESFGFDPSKYVALNPTQLSGENFINADQANRLNTLSQALGSPSSYAAGSRPDEYSFDQKKAFDQIMSILLGYSTVNQPDGKPAYRQVTPGAVNVPGADPTQGVVLSTQKPVNPVPPPKLAPPEAVSQEDKEKQHRVGSFGIPTGQYY